MKITARKKSIIKLPCPSPGGIHSLSSIDQIVYRSYTQFLLFFPSASEEQHRSMIDNLKASLSTTLAIFYPLAGRYAVFPDGFLQVECSDQGIEFTEATTDAKLDDFGGFEQHDPCFELLSPCGGWRVNEEEDITAVPLAVAQYTRFQCGGSSLVLGLHHNVGDGSSTSSFLTAWSLVARGREDDVVAPCFRHALVDGTQLRVDPAKLYTHSEYKSVHFPSVPGAMPEIKTCMFTFNVRDILSLKSSRDDSDATKFEVLAAHLWKSITKARRLDPLEETNFNTAVDGRKRFTPPLPETSFGNIAFLARATSSAQKLTDNPLSYAINLVHGAIHRITDEYMRSVVHWLERNPVPVGGLVGYSNFSTDLMVSSWSRFPLHEADFGGGKPVFVGLPFARLISTVILLPSSDKETMVVVVGLFAEHMRNLLEDPDFLLQNVNK